MAQPPLTRTIKLLERELDTKLLDRTTRSVALTPSGEALVEPARQVLEALARAVEVALGRARRFGSEVVQVAPDTQNGARAGQRGGGMPPHVGLRRGQRP